MTTDSLALLPSLNVGDWIAVVSLTFNAIVGIPVAVKKIGYWVRRRRLRYLVANDEVLIHIPSRNIRRFREVVAQEDYEAGMVFLRMLEKYGYRPKICYVSPEGKITLDGSVSNVIICGPKNSPTVKDFFMGLAGLTLEKKGALWHFRDKVAGTILQSPMDNVPPVEADLGFLGKIHLPATVGAPVLLVCGIHAIGSLGIASVLDSTSKLDHLLRIVGEKNFYAVVRSKYSPIDRSIIDAELYIGPRTL